MRNFLGSKPKKIRLSFSCLFICLVPFYIHFCADRLANKTPRRNGQRHLLGDSARHGCWHWQPDRGRCADGKGRRQTNLLPCPAWRDGAFRAEKRHHRDKVHVLVAAESIHRSCALDTPERWLSDPWTKWITHPYVFLPCKTNTCCSINICFVSKNNQQFSPRKILYSRRSSKFIVSSNLFLNLFSITSSANVRNTNKLPKLAGWNFEFGESILWPVSRPNSRDYVLVPFPKCKVLGWFGSNIVADSNFGKWPVFGVRLRYNKLCALGRMTE